MLGAALSIKFAFIKTLHNSIDSNNPITLNIFIANSKKLITFVHY